MEQEKVAFSEEEEPIVNEGALKAQELLESWDKETAIQELKKFLVRNAEDLKENFDANYIYFDRLKDSLGLFDIIFILLAIGTAYKIGLGKES